MFNVSIRFVHFGLPEKNARNKPKINIPIFLSKRIKINSFHLHFLQTHYTSLKI